MRALPAAALLTIAALCANGHATDPANDACADPEPRLSGDLWLVGNGLCVSGTNLTATGFMCNQSEACALFGSAAACGAVCEADPSCTGFETSSNLTSSNQVTCKVFTVDVPSSQPAWLWSLSPGGQGTLGHSVVTSSGDAGSCCYKRAYPSPNPVDNPVKKMAKQSARQKAIYALQAAEAAVASATALPNLTSLIDFCATNTDLFGPEKCPGMVYALRDGAKVCACACTNTHCFWYDRN